MWTKNTPLQAGYRDDREGDGETGRRAGRISAEVADLPGRVVGCVWDVISGFLSLFSWPPVPAGFSPLDSSPLNRQARLRNPSCYSHRLSSRRQSTLSSLAGPVWGLDHPSAHGRRSELGHRTKGRGTGSITAGKRNSGGRAFPERKARPFVISTELDLVFQAAGQIAHLYATTGGTDAFAGSNRETEPGA